VRSHRCWALIKIIEGSSPRGTGILDLCAEFFPSIAERDFDVRELSLSSFTVKTALRQRPYSG
jgi:hypothetical protein